MSQKKKIKKMLQWKNNGREKTKIPHKTREVGGSFKGKKWFTSWISNLKYLYTEMIEKTAIVSKKDTKKKSKKLVDRKAAKG